MYISAQKMSYPGSTGEDKATGRLINPIAKVFVWVKVLSPGPDKENPEELISN